MSAYRLRRLAKTPMQQPLNKQLSACTTRLLRVKILAERIFGKPVRQLFLRGLDCLRGGELQDHGRYILPVLKHLVDIRCS